MVKHKTKTEMHELGGLRYYVKYKIVEEKKNERGEVILTFMEPIEIVVPKDIAKEQLKQLEAYYPGIKIVKKGNKDGGQ